MGIVSYIKEEIRVVRERDPAIKSNMEVLLYPSFRVILIRELKSDAACLLITGVELSSVRQR